MHSTTNDRVLSVKISECLMVDNANQTDVTAGEHRYKGYIGENMQFIITPRLDTLRRDVDRIPG